MNLIFWEPHCFFPEETLPHSFRYQVKNAIPLLFKVEFLNVTVKFKFHGELYENTANKFVKFTVKFSKNWPNLNASFSRHRRFTLTLQSWRYCCVCIGFRVARMLPWTVVTRHRRSRPAEARNPHITAHCGEVRAHEAFRPYVGDPQLPRFDMKSPLRRTAILWFTS